MLTNVPLQLRETIKKVGVLVISKGIKILHL